MAERSQTTVGGWRNLPGVWQLREGPRMIGALILSVFGLCAFLVVYRFDRVLGSESALRLSGHWLGMFTIVVATSIAVWAGWRRPPRPRYGKSQWQIVRERFVHSPQAQLGLFLVVMLALISLLAPLIATHDPDAFGNAAKTRLKAPLQGGFLVGSDHFGRDLFSRMVYGSRISLLIGVVAVSLSATLGLVNGLLAGYFGGSTDSLIMRAVDVMLAIPRLVLLLVVVALFKDVEAFRGANRIFLIVGILGATGWMGTARLVRGEVLSLKERDFVQAGRALGFGPFRLIFRHIAPNCLSPVIVAATLGLGGTILVEAALSYLGLGVPPPTPSWGQMINDGQDFLDKAWWYSTFPGLAIVFGVMSFNLLGDGLRDALDPRAVLRSSLVTDDDEEDAEGEAA